MRQAISKMLVRKRSVLLVFLLSTSCASMDQDLLDARLPETPETWSAPEASTGVPVGNWVAAFQDNRLEELIGEATLRNNNLLASAANLDAARQAHRRAFAALLPTLDANPSVSRSAFVQDPAFAAQIGGSGIDVSDVRVQDLEDQFGVDLDGDGAPDVLDQNGDGIFEPIPNRRSYVNNFLLNAQIRWEIDLWGRLRDTNSAAQRDAAASLADYKAARLSLAANVAQTWFTLIEARQQRELAERDVEARERNLKVTSRRYERGVASSLDVRLAQSQVGSSRASLAQRQRTENESGRRLEVLLGRYPGAELEAAAALPDLPALPDAGAPSEILTRRPDIIAAEMRMEAAGLRARAARKRILPTLTLSSRLSTSGPDLEDVLDPERLAGNIAAGLFQPLFRGGEIQANSRQQRAIAEQRLLTYAQTVLEAFEETENALAAENYLALQEDALKLAFDEAAAAEKLTERRYANGAASIFNLLDAQTRRISTESSYISAKRQRVSNRVVLYLAIGGNFITEQELRLARDKQVDSALRGTRTGKALPVAVRALTGE